MVPTGEREEIAAKPIEAVTLDDLAFAMGALDDEFTVLSDRMHALRKLYALGRKAGGFGADNAVDLAIKGDR